jgi:formylglycine-generating enzyme required for sulfatase activity
VATPSLCCGCRRAGRGRSTGRPATASTGRLVDPTGPVAHVSYFEADAFATWFGKRLPSETEWEVATQRLDVDGNFLDLIRVRP